MRNRTGALVGAIVACLLARAALADSPGVAPDGAARAAIAAAVDAYRGYYGIAGGAVAVLRGQAVVYSATFGEADLESHAPVDLHTRFQLSSSTKLFTGTLMTMLARDGLVDFAMPVRDYLPALPVSWSDVLLEDIMAHLSGLPEVLECDEPDDPEAALTCVTALERAGPRREKFRYNQTNYLLALMVVEKVTGTGFADALANRVLRPAGMQDTLWNGDSNDTVARRATGYYPDKDGGVAPREYRFPPYLMSAAGLNATLADMIAFGRALNSGALLDMPSRKRMWRASVLADGSAAFYAIGWDLRELRGGGNSAGHEGGSLTTFRVYPDAGLTVIVLFNGLHRYFGLDAFADLLAETVEPGLLPESRSRLYQARLRYFQDGIDGALDTLATGGCAEDRDTTACNELIDQLAEDLDDAGRTVDAATLRGWRMPAP